MCYRLATFACVYVICALEVHAVGVEVDIVTFYGNDSLTYCEIYVGVERDVLYYNKVGEDSLVAEFSIVSSLAMDNAVFLSDTIDTRDAVRGVVQRDAGSYFPYTFRYFMRPGEYELDISLLQQAARSVHQVKRTFYVSEVRDAFGLSGIALGAEMSFTDSSSAFYRTGLHFVPNPSGFYGRELPMLYYYLECYGLSADANFADSLTITRRVLFAESGEPAKQPAVRRLKKPGTSAVITDGFPAYTLRTGTYQLEIVVSEPGMPDRKAKRKFYVYRPEDLAVGRDAQLDPEMQSLLLASSGNILDRIDPDSAITLMKYLLTRQDDKRVRNMDAEGKRAFLIDFWKNREPSDAEAPNRYFARVAEANRRYSFLQNEGWRTDRGRVLIMYGEPDVIDRRYAEAQVPDHEIWHFDRIEGGVYFVFFDRSGFGDLDLVHSTKRGEIYNPNWMQNIPDKNTSTRGLR
ncbi:GWxTD domain-containing protein [bacterium]|nr:GWxTD domain-containing protein [bacterium]